MTKFPKEIDIRALKEKQNSKGLLIMITYGMK